MNQDIEFKKKELKPLIFISLRMYNKLSVSRFFFAFSKPLGFICF